MLATGLLATSASPLAILQAPTSWPELVLLSQTVAAATLLVYHAANAYRIASSGRHLGAAAAALIVGTPYVVGGLVLLESDGLMQSLGGGLTPGAAEASPRCWNSWDGCSLSSASTRPWLRGLGWRRSRLASEVSPCPCSLLAVAIAAVAAFLDRGSRVGSDRGLLARRQCGCSPRADHRPFAGRTVGRGLPRSPGCSWTRSMDRHRPGLGVSHPSRG